MATRDYEHDGLTVHWDSSRCIHVGACLQRGDGAFDSTRRPWVDLTLTDHDTVVDAVEACPTGALTWSATDGTAETPPPTTTMVPLRGGPMVVRGDIAVVDREGRTIATGPRAALCRCSNSGNQPFCDNSHRTAGFDEPEPRGDDEDPAAPDEVCPPQEF
jgi:uncharacterized Fe-S cluster protein YjdI/CDGSH-type Zn-finger protein